MVGLEGEPAEKARTGGGRAVGIDVVEQRCGVRTERIETIGPIGTDDRRRAAADEFEPIGCRPRDPRGRLRREERTERAVVDLAGATHQPSVADARRLLLTSCLCHHGWLEREALERVLPVSGALAP